MPTHCPIDSAELDLIEVDGLELDTCPTCGGLWFDRDELRRAEHLADPEVDWMDLELWKHLERFQIEARAHGCPRCAKPMVRLRYGDEKVELDHCASCGGVWLEAGALERILLALEKEASTKPAFEYLRRTLREALAMIKDPRHVAQEWSQFKHFYEMLKVRLMIEHPALVKAIMESRGADPL